MKIEKARKMNSSHIHEHCDQTAKKLMEKILKATRQNSILHTEQW